MSLGQRLEDILSRFEKATDGVLGTSVLSRAQALMLVGSSQTFDKSIIEGMSVRFLGLAVETLQPMMDNPVLESVTIEEANHIISILTINPEYFVVVISDKSELSGLRQSNLEKLTQQLNKAIIA